MSIDERKHNEDLRIKKITVVVGKKGTSTGSVVNTVVGLMGSRNDTRDGRNRSGTGELVSGEETTKT